MGSQSSSNQQVSGSKSPDSTQLFPTLTGTQSSSQQVSNTTQLLYAHIMTLLMSEDDSRQVNTWIFLQQQNNHTQFTTLTSYHRSLCHAQPQTLRNLPSSRK